MTDSEMPKLPSPAVVDPGRFGVAWSAEQVWEYAREYAARTAAPVAATQLEELNATPSATPPVDVEALIAKAKAATPGNWSLGLDDQWNAEFDGPGCTSVHVMAEGRAIAIVVEGSSFGRDDILDANADYILATFPPVVLALCEEIKRLRASSVGAAVDDGVKALLKRCEEQEAKHADALARRWLWAVDAPPEIRVKTSELRSALAQEQS